MTKKLKKGYATHRELSPEIITKVKNVVQPLRGMASNLNDCIKHHNGSLLAERCNKYSTDLAQLARALNNLTSELE